MPSNEERLRAAEKARREQTLGDTQHRLRELLERKRRGETRATGSVAVPTAPQPGAGTFCSGAAIRVTQVRGSSGHGDLGVGCLLDDVSVGAPVRFSLEEGPAVVTSPVRSLQRLGARSIQVGTGNSVYRFDLQD